MNDVMFKIGALIAVITAIAGGILEVTASATTALIIHICGPIVFFAAILSGIAISFTDSFVLRKNEIVGNKPEEMKE